MHCEPQENNSRCLVCGFLYFFNPAVGNGNILINEAGEILLLRRAKEPSAGCWDTPGGFIEAGETPEQGAQREIFEETGLSVTQLEYFVALPNVYEYTGVRYDLIDIFFVGHIVGEPQIRLQESEVTEYQFFEPKDIDLPGIGFDSVRRALALYISR
ncbi:MAG: NUDIX domain-containing protein [Candidatus Kerfeldbacteria bacterium]|nr:NUDIX domain-containing protein [Candidatus Kerfeldbacteria bacterium]